jgi:hypothetical protein
VETFDDPNFKAALKRTLGAETAPAGLRQRVLSALDESEASGRNAWLTFRGQKMGLMAIAAALVLLVVGYAVFRGMNGSGGNDRDKQVAMKLFKPFAVAMAAGHDNASTEFATTSNPDANALAQQLQSQVDVKPVVSLPGDSGWRLRGAKVATLNNVSTAQAVFSKGDSKISVFSLPAKATYTTQDGAKYELMENRHPIAGFVRKSAMYCVVGDAGASLDDLKKLADALEQATKA